MNRPPLNIKISGLGHSLPATVITSAELEKTYRIPAGWVKRITGVVNRRYAKDETSVSMAGQASRRALEAAGLSAGDLDAIIGASAGRAQAIPCTAAFVQREIGAPDGRSVCFDVDATCLSFMVALQQAAVSIAAGLYRHVLVFSSEITSYSLNPKQWESASLFGDAAAAAIVSACGPEDGSLFHSCLLRTYSSGAELTQLVGGGTRHHPNDPTTTPEMNLFDMEGPAVLKKAARLVPSFLDDFFAQVGWNHATADVVVPHQASAVALEMLTGRLGFSPEQVFINLPERGNCIAASIPLALSEAVEAGRVKRGSKVLLVGTGAGLSLGAVALTY